VFYFFFTKFISKNLLMSHLEIFLLAIALAADAFSVGAAVGLKHCASRQRFRLSFHFGLFQALMPLLGALIGAFLLHYVQEFDHWIAFALLCFVGIRMILESQEEEEEAEECKDTTRGWSLIMLSTAVSIDALAAGISMAATQVNIYYAVTVIGLVSWIATYVAMLIGKRLGEHFGSRCEMAAGFVLVGLGVKILYMHLY
jgi:putative Mn2+ efflux pump MntP